MRFYFGFVAGIGGVIVTLFLCAIIGFWFFGDETQTWPTWYQVVISFSLVMSGVFHFITVFEFADDSYDYNNY